MFEVCTLDDTGDWCSSGLEAHTALEAIGMMLCDLGEDNTQACVMRVRDGAIIAHAELHRNGWLLV